MALEVPAYVPDLVSTNPPNTDQRKQGDDHLRAIKLAVKQSFDLIGGGMTTGGTSTALTVTTGHLNSPTYKDGHLYAFALHTAIGAAATINYDAIGARTLKKRTAGAWANVAANDYASGDILLCYYESGDSTMRIIGSSGVAGDVGPHLPLAGGTMTGNILLTDSAASIVRVGETTTGFYLTAGVVHLSVAGTDRLVANSSGVSVTGTLTSSGLISVTGGGITTSSDANFGGTIGSIAGDVNFSLLKPAAGPRILLDSGPDALDYNRSTNQFLHLIGGTSALTVDAGFVFPGSDNIVTLGGASNRWVQVYAVSGTINTSDQREKDNIRDLTEAERRVGRRIRDLLRIYQWRDRIAVKGADRARLHIGVMAQDVEAAFAAEGLDGWAYGVLCRDEITTPVKVKQLVTRRKTQTLRTRRVGPDGVMRPVVVETDVTELKNVVDEAGNPVWEVDGDGNPTSQPMQVHVPVLEEVEIEVEEVQPTGEYRLGLRHDQLTMFMLAG